MGTAEQRDEPRHGRLERLAAAIGQWLDRRELLERRERIAVAVPLDRREQPVDPHRVRGQLVADDREEPLSPVEVGLRGEAERLDRELDTSEPDRAVERRPGDERRLDPRGRRGPQAVDIVARVPGRSVQLNFELRREICNEARHVAIYWL